MWQGSAFDCRSGTNSISLRHSQFSDIESVVGVCNGESIKAQGISSLDNSYVSQLNVTVSESILGETIQCAYDDGRIITVIGESTLTITEGIYFKYA